MSSKTRDLVKKGRLALFAGETSEKDLPPVSHDIVLSVCLHACLCLSHVLLFMILAPLLVFLLVHVCPVASFHGQMIASRPLVGNSGNGLNQYSAAISTVCPLTPSGVYSYQLQHLSILHSAPACLRFAHKAFAPRLSRLTLDACQHKYRGEHPFLA